MSMIDIRSDTPLNPDCVEIARRRRRLDAAGTPMGFLFERLGEDLAERIEITGGWGDSVLYIGFKTPNSGLPRRPEHAVSLLEGDDWTDIRPGFDIVVLNLQLAWLNHEFWFQRIFGLLNPGGRFYFSSLGPDTLHQLDDAWRGVDELPHVHPFVDIHHLGDALVKAGFSQPVLDADWMGVEYEDVDLLMEDLRREGFHNVHPSRRRTLTGKSRLAAIRQRLDEQSPLRITFELLFGFATVPEASTGTIRVSPPVL